MQSVGRLRSCSSSFEVIGSRYITMLARHSGVWVNTYALIKTMVIRHALLIQLQLSRTRANWLT